MAVILITLIVSAAILYFINSCIKPKNYPPGPRWLPLVGCSRAAASSCKKHGSQHMSFAQLAKEYSTPVLGLKLGKELVVVVFGEKCVVSVLTREEFEGRPINYFMKLRCLGKRIGITGTDGLLWREHRQFALKHLKDVGFGKRVMEDKILNELNDIVNHLKNNSLSVNLKVILAPAVMNVLWEFTAGQCLSKDGRLRTLLDLLNTRSKAFSMSGGWLNEYPWIRHIFPESSGYTLICKINRDLMAIISDAIQKHKERQIKGEDFIYAFLREMEAGHKTYTEEQLSMVCLDLLIAGSQTTSVSLEFAFLMALRNQGVQEKIFNEISSILGNAQPCWSDHKRLPYTMSFLLEVQRYFSIAPLIGPRRALNDTTISGYNIPKDTTILLSIYDLHHDPNTWNDPESFIPHRFLDKGDSLKDTERLFHFGLGRRRCPGDSLAKRFIFLIFVGVLQKFRVSCSNGVLPTCKPVCGIICSPVEYTADFFIRN